MYVRLEVEQVGLSDVILSCCCEVPALEQGAYSIACQQLIQHSGHYCTLYCLLALLCYAFTKYSAPDSVCTTAACRQVDTDTIQTVCNIYAVELTLRNIVAHKQ
jgi:hypothetical protein